MTQLSAGDLWRRRLGDKPQSAFVWKLSQTPAASHPGLIDRLYLPGGGQAPFRPPPVAGRTAGRAKPALRVHAGALASVANINDVLEGHVALEIECVDRLYLNGYVPALQVGGQVIRFLCGHLGKPIASSALFEPIGNRFRREVSGSSPTQRSARRRGAPAAQAGCARP